MVELATAYIPIVAETSGIPRAVNAAFGQADRQAEAAGKSMGSKMSSALGGALKVGAAAAAAGGAAAIGTAMVKGFQRLDAIDQATGKLAALGNSAQTTTQVMDSALAAVKGTAYGLGDAATIAASAIAAGIKPGQDLTKYLGSVADTAAIAGSSLGDMGAIFNQVQTGQKAYTDDLNQLADRGIPIYQWLADEAGVAAGEVKKLASEGKIDSETFFAAIQKNVGGAAKTIGSTTVRGAIENIGAALGRLGAAAEKPFFARLPGQLSGATAAIDNLTPKVGRLAETLDEKIFEEWGPKIRAAFETFQRTGAIDDARLVFEELSQAVGDAAPSIGEIATALAQASAALGVSGWQLFLTALQTGTSVLEVLNPLLSTTADLMRDNQAVVTALVAAWLAFRTVPGLIGSATAALSPMTARLSAARSSVAGFGDAYRQSMQWVQQANPGISTAGAHLQVLRANGASASGVMGGLRSAGAGVAALFGGPLGLALTGVAVGGTAVAASMAESKREAQAFESAARDLVEAQKELGQQLIGTRGDLTPEVYRSLGEQVDLYREKIDAAAEADAKWSDVMFDILQKGGRGDADQTAAQLDAAAGSAQQARQAFADLGMTSDQVGRLLAGSAGEWDSFTGRLRAMGDGGNTAADQLQELRDRVLQQRDVAQRITPGIGELGDAIRVLGDKSASSSSKLNALKTAMDAMNPARTQVEAMAQYGDSIRQVADAAQGIDATAFGDTGNLDALSTAGSTLSRTLADLADKAAQVASTGGDMGAVAAQNEQVFARLAEATGQPIEKIRDLYNQLGGNTVNLSVAMSGAPEVVQQLATVKAALDQQPDKKTIEIESGQLTQQTLDMLDQLGIKWRESPDGKTIQIDAIDNASAKIALVTQNLNIVAAIKANPTIDLDKALFDAKDTAAHAALAALDRTAVSPEAGIVIDDLLAGKEVSMQQLDILNRTTANPVVDMAIDAIMAKIRIVNDGIDNAARRRIAEIDVQARTSYFGAPNVQGPVPITAYDTGGWTGPGSKYQPAGIVHADEFVLSKAARGSLEAAMPGGLDYANATGRWPGYADGGHVTAEALRRLAEGQGASRPLTGAPYVWGGINWGDCSSAMSAFARLAAGLDPFGGRFSTGTQAEQLRQMGFTSGSGGSGDLRFGWVNGGPGGGHTAGTLPDGTNVEMGGSYGGGMVGGTVGADSSQFTNRAYMRIGPSWTDPGSDPGGFVTRPDGTVEYVPGRGGYATTGNSGGTSSGGSSSSGGGAGRASLSSRLGGAASAFVEGQVKSLLGVLSINDSPGALAALAEYEQQRAQSAQSANAGTAPPAARPAPMPTPTDPGTTTPAPGEDVGTGGLPSTGDAVKDAFRLGLREAWRQGAPWSDTDWIIGKESSWNPVARNPSSGAFGLPQFLGSTKAQYLPDENPDPTVQGSAYDRYVGDRYGDPTGARRHWEQEGWYDDGGVIHEGTTLVRNGLRHKETALPFDPDDLKRSLDRGAQGVIGTDQVLGKLDAILQALLTVPRGQVNYNLPADRSVERVEKIEDQRRRAALAGR